MRYLLHSRFDIRAVQYSGRRYRKKMSDSDVIEIEYGKVRGIKKVSALETPYTAFLGVPYAKAPLGELRFKVSITNDSFVRILMFKVQTYD